MSMLYITAIKSLFDRKITVSLCVISLAISMFVLFSINHLSAQSKANFFKSVANTDLIVGARTSDINLLLYSVFRIGQANNHVSHEFYKNIDQHPSVKWTAPILLGDSAYGFHVIGTTENYFNYALSSKQSSVFAQGNVFDGLTDVVLGAKVAKQLNKKIGDDIIISHGLGTATLTKHDHLPMTVSGILHATGSNADLSIFVDLPTIEAIHVGFVNGSQIIKPTKQQLQTMDLTPKSVTAILIGLNKKQDTFKMQRQINQYKQEPVTALLPGVTLSKLWRSLSQIEFAMTLIANAVLIAALLGLATMLFMTLQHRKKEFKLLRIIGSSHGFIFCIVLFEVLFITISALILATISLNGLIYIFSDWLATEYQVTLSNNIFSMTWLYYVLGIIAITLSTAFISALLLIKRDQ